MGPKGLTFEPATGRDTEHDEQVALPRGTPPTRERRQSDTPITSHATDAESQKGR